jgi:hypothetical protein
MAVIEARAYGPDCTAEERAALAGRVSRYQDDIILLRELPVMTVFTVDVLFDEVDRLTAGWSSYAGLVDLTETRARPSAEVREALRRRLQGSAERIRHAALLTESYLMTVAARFVFGGLAFNSMSIHRTREQALEALRNARR